MAILEPYSIGSNWSLDIGADNSGKETTFRVWAPFRKSIAVRLLKQGRTIEMTPGVNGYFSLSCIANPGEDYYFLLDGKTKRSDPASRFQPKGVHGPSRIMSIKEFEWTDLNWRGISRKDLIIYELHVGTFTKGGDFESVIPALHYLRKELGITAVELMPVGQFPGKRNWGYDGAYMYAVQNSYGGPEGLKRLVDACHAEGLSFILDVVYNHLGPEGNYLPEYGPYLSTKYHTPWGQTLNYDDAGSDEVRHYVLGNALYWISEYHVDGLRLDAIHGIYDFSPKHLLLEMSELTRSLASSVGRKFHLIAESDLNDPIVLDKKERRGFECDAQWSDDFHHSVHAYLTGERQRHYMDYGQLKDISKALEDEFVYEGNYSKYRQRTQGAPARGLSGDRFVIFTQNHDQVGNRALGERSSVLVSKEKLKLQASLCLLSGNLPLLFMGEEYAETSPFYYFVSHSDKNLVKAVRKGRRKDLGLNQSKRFVDPQSKTAFAKSKIDLGRREEGTCKEIFEFYQKLISLRKSHNVFSDLEGKTKAVTLAESECILVSRKSRDEEMLQIYSFGPLMTRIPSPVSEGHWDKILDSSGAAQELVSGTDLVVSPLSVTVYSRSR